MKKTAGGDPCGGVGLLGKGEGMGRCGWWEGEGGLGNGEGPGGEKAPAGASTAAAVGKCR